MAKDKVKRLPDSAKIPTLEKHIITSTTNIAKVLADAKKSIEAKIRKAVEKRSLITEDKRNATYKAILAIYEDLDIKIDEYSLDAVKAISDDFFSFALGDLDISPDASDLKYSSKYVSNLWERINPDAEAHIAAVRTKAMSNQDINQLRALAVDSLRQASVEGATAKGTYKLMRDRWLDLVDKGKLDSWQFIDKAGKKWDNNNYFSMLQRTLAARVSRDTYADTLTANGKDLAKIKNNSGKCPACGAFNNVIVSISGTNPDYPSLQDAKDAGWGHPNCLCRLSYIDEDFDKEEIEEQANEPLPKEPSKEQWSTYGKQIRARTEKLGEKREVKKGPDQTSKKNAGLPKKKDVK